MIGEKRLDADGRVTRSGAGAPNIVAGSTAPDGGSPGGRGATEPPALIEEPPIKLAPPVVNADTAEGHDSTQRNSDAVLFEQQKWRDELEWRNAELEFKRRAQECEHKIKEAELAFKKRESWRSPLMLAVVAATVAGIANVFVAYYNGGSQRALEFQKAEQARILEMVKTDEKQAINNLRFLSQIGLIADPAIRNKIDAYKPKSGEGVALPPQIASARREELAPVNTNLHLDLTDVALLGRYTRRFCLVSRDQIMSCYSDTGADCQNSYNKMPDDIYKPSRRCAQRSDILYCYTFRGRASDKLLHACFLSNEGCTEGIDHQRMLPGVVDISAQCEPFSPPK